MRLGLDCRKDFSDELLTFGRQLACTDVISGGGASATEYVEVQLSEATDDARASWPETRQALSEAQMLMNVEEFLKAVLPVAEAEGVKMALHPDDPPVPSFYVDMAKAMRHYNEAGVDAPLIDDHVPHISEDDSYQHRSRAFAMGYIKALLDAVRTN